MKIILSVNAGSSSVKVSVFSVEACHAPPRELAEAQISGLTAPPALLDYRRGKTVVHKAEPVRDIPAIGTGAEAGAETGAETGAEGSSASRADSDSAPLQDAAFHVLLRTLIKDPDLPEIASPGDVAFVTHRIVHGGDYSQPQVIGRDTSLKLLERLNDLAPLHNARALAIVNACLRALPAAVNIACFDSQFHASLPEHIRTYPIDQTLARSNMLRKYGFHGLSYAFITRSVASFLGKPADATNIIALHLGSGASACAIRGGRSWDTSMGLTPLAGLPGATRSGSVDPSLVFHYASDVGRLSPASTSELHISRAEEILNKEAGWKALTGTTNFAKIASSSEPSHRLAFDLFVDRVCGFVGSYFVTLSGQVDALVFAGGIGEHSDRLRAAVVDQCRCLGFAIDEAANHSGFGDSNTVVVDISQAGAAHRVLICQTDEQLEMARSSAEDERLWE